MDGIAQFEPNRRQRQDDMSTEGANGIPAQTTRQMKHNGSKEGQNQTEKQSIKIKQKANRNRETRKQEHQKNEKKKQ